MDINRLNINWGGAGFPEYAGECKSGPSGVEKQAKEYGTADRASRESQIASMGQDLSDVEGATIQDTSMYKRGVTEATDSTSAAYDNARAKRMAAANRAGFGYAQPVTQGDQATVDALEAKDIGEIPLHVADSVAERRMQAAGIRSGAASMYNTSAMNDLNVQQRAEEARQKRMQSMWGGIAKLGLKAGAGFATGGWAGMGSAIAKG